MQNMISQIQYDDKINDGWVFRWGNDRYSSQKVYKLAFEGLQVPRTFQWLWKRKCTPRIKFFAWLMMVDRLNTKIMLRRRHYNTQAGIYCILCNHNAEEDVDHLFFGCPFAVNCWLRLNIVWDLDLELHHRISQTRSVFQQVHGGLSNWSMGIVEGQKCSHI